RVVSDFPEERMRQRSPAVRSDSAGFRRVPSIHSPGKGVRRMDATGEPRVVLVHDWLTGMRGGEKCLEVLCRRWPEAPLYTLLHRPGSVSAHIERRDVRTSSLQNLPGVH